MATRQAFLKNLRDNDLRVLTALPGAASTTVNGNGLDTGVRTDKAVFPLSLEFVCKIPALNTTQLPNAATLTLSIEMSNDVAFGSGITQLGSLVVTGAGGVGAAATELRVTPPREMNRYVRAKYVTGAGTGSQAASNGEFCLVE